MGQNGSEYRKLQKKYLGDGEKLLRKGDYVQASEKFWGAAAQAVKVVAETRGWKHNGHAMLFQIVDRLSTESSDKDLNRLFRAASQLHQNFYENWLTRAQVELDAQDTKRFLHRLNRL